MVDNARRAIVIPLGSVVRPMPYQWLAVGIARGLLASPFNRRWLEFPGLDGHAMTSPAALLCLEQIVPKM
jgi:hypothetical protein